MKKYQKLPLETFFAIVLLVSCSPNDDLLNKQYSYEDLKNGICIENPKHCVEIDKSLYFVDEDFVFKFDINTLNKEYTDGFDVKEIIEYKGYVVGLTHNKRIYLLDKENSKEWIEIGNNTTTIESNDADLFALTKKGEIWTYQGEPGDIKIIFIPIVTSCGTGCMTTIMIPSINGRKIAFEKTQFTDIQALYKNDNGDIIIEFITGSKKVLQ